MDVSTDLKKLLRLHLISRKNKHDTKKLVVKPVATCTSETWRLKKEERRLDLFERRILTNIFEAVQDKGQW
jgi:hypothetical protein